MSFGSLRRKLSNPAGQLRALGFVGRVPTLLGLIGLVAAGATSVCAAEAGLRQLVDQALSTHPAIQTQQALLSAARESVTSARWQYFPTPSVSVQNAASDSSDPSYGGDKSVTILGLNQPLWTGGRIEAGIARAQANAQGAVANVADAQQQLALRVVQTYGDWLSAHRKKAAYAMGQTQHIRLKDQVARRIQEGQAAASDLALAQSRLASLQADYAQAVTQEEVSLARLSQLLGQPVAPLALAGSPAQPWPVRGSAGELLAQAQAASPALARARSNAQAQLAVVQEAKSATLPEVSLRLEHQVGNFSYSGAPPQTRGFVNLSSRFGAGLSSLSAVTEALARHAGALAEIESQQRSLSEQILADHALLVSSQARRQALAQSAELADQVLASWDRQYLSGRKSWQDLMNSAREQVQVQAQLADLDGSQLVASWRLAISTGQYALPPASFGPDADLCTATGPAL